MYMQPNKISKLLFKGVRECEDNPKNAKNSRGQWYKETDVSV